MESARIIVVTEFRLRLGFQPQQCQLPHCVSECLASGHGITIDLGGGGGGGGGGGDARDGDVGEFERDSFGTPLPTGGSSTKRDRKGSGPGSEA